MYFLIFEFRAQSSSKIEKGKFSDMEGNGHRKLKDILKDIYFSV